MGFEQLAGRRRYLAGVWPILCYALVRPDPSTEGFERRSIEVGSVAHHRRGGVEHPLGGPRVGVRAEHHAVHLCGDHGRRLRRRARVGDDAHLAPSLRLTDLLERRQARL